MGQTPPSVGSSLARARVEKITPDDLLGEYQLHLDGVPYWPQLGAGTAGAARALVRDRSARHIAGALPRRVLPGQQERVEP